MQSGEDEFEPLSAACDPQPPNARRSEMTSSSERALETRVSALETEIYNLKQQIITLGSHVTRLENELRPKANKAP
jgi:uncharacterized protein YceH (UPF0502 family)